jgi:hypothetical protein
MGLPRLKRQVVQREHERQVADDERLLTIREIERLPLARVCRLALMSAVKAGTLPCEVRRYGSKKANYIRYADVKRRFAPAEH